eukprot:NODE_5686_length_649_cov_23.811667_g5299_i0.p1 GENE.NODE_5686_length_649_cov_23.811667_g5299_i0~~NODE_5686_length_649_cov_23.811667_g5299_i0.p1  ORF type:complete len:157 (+),score=32.40 NODE_5686_length_649_cov_23.811667_g5299_i0:70-540(+)
MTTIVVEPRLLQATMIATAFTTLKLLGTFMMQGRVRFLAGARPPEDGKLQPKYGVQSFGAQKGDKVTPEQETEMRWTRIVSNDLENIPLGLIIMWATMLTAKNSNVQIVLAGLFAISRFLHTISYAKSLQPHRALAWLGGTIAILGMLVNGLAGVF